MRRLHKRRIGLKLKPSEILSKIKKKNWTTGKYWDMDDAGLKYCFNGYILQTVLGYPEPENGDIDLNRVYDWNLNGRLIHDVIADINDSKTGTFTQKKKQAIAFLEREGL